MKRTLARLGAARGAAEVARLLCAAVPDPPVRAVALWRVDGADAGLLRALGSRGVPDAALLHARPRTPDAPLWRGVEAREPVRLERVPDGLESVQAAAWWAVPLRGDDGSPAGVALCGGELPPEAAELLTLAGPILARAIAGDRHRLRAELFDELTALARDGVIVATPDGAVLTYNPALQRMTGWTGADVRQFGWTNLVYPDPAVRMEIQRGIAALTLGRPSEGIVRTLARKDGTEIRAAIWSRLVPDPAGGAPAMLGVMQDVTSEEASRKRELRDESLARLGRLAGGIAHEFNNLLCAMMGHAELVALTPGLPASAADHAETIVQGAQRGAHLSSQLLAFSGTANTRPRPADLATVVEQAVTLWKPRLAEGIAVHVHAEPLPLAELDEHQMQQALINLLANAGDAMGASGRLDVEVGSAVPPADARFRAPDAPLGAVMARVRVRDSGPGFSAEALAHLFEPFFSGKDRGHGIGLPAVRAILASQRGVVDVRPGRGAVVDLYLPFSQRPEVALPELVRDVGARGESVWVIDDQPQVLEFCRISLEAHGYRVRVFDGVASVSGADPNPAPDVIVLDVVMADGGGPAALAHLRRVGMHAPVVWISGHTPDVVQLPEVGVFLQKPFTGRDLAAVVRRLLDTASPTPRPAHGP